MCLSTKRLLLESQYASLTYMMETLPAMQFHEKTGYWAVTAMRSSFDFITNYGPGKMDECKWLQRIVFLETVAGVPGMVGGMVQAPPHNLCEAQHLGAGSYPSEQEDHLTLL